MPEIGPGKVCLLVCLPIYLCIYLFIYLFLGEEVRARARFWRDQSLLDRANAMELRSCDSLERIAAAAG